jgi:hypothetical protein
MDLPASRRSRNVRPFLRRPHIGRLPPGLEHRRRLLSIDPDRSDRVDRDRQRQSVRTQLVAARRTQVARHRSVEGDAAGEPIRRSPCCVSSDRRAISRCGCASTPCRPSAARRRPRSRIPARADAGQAQKKAPGTAGEPCPALCSGAGGSRTRVRLPIPRSVYVRIPPFLSPRAVIGRREAHHAPATRSRLRRRGTGRRPA